MRFLFLIVTACLSSFLAAQNVGIGTTSPNANALLHVDLKDSITKGLLVTGSYNESSGTVPVLPVGSSMMMYYPGIATFRAGYINFSNRQSVGKASTSIGWNTAAAGNFSTAIGTDNYAKGFASTAFGYGTEALEAYSMTMGYGSRSSGFGSLASGILTYAKGSGSTVVGMYNDSILTGDQVVATPETPLFIVGNGNGHNNRSNALVVQKNGSVGLGTSYPHNSALLHVDLKQQVTKGLLVTGETDIFTGSVPDIGPGTRFMFFPGKAALRGGHVYGTQWNNSNVGLGSTALGLNNIASGDWSIALGSDDTASGANAVAIGLSSSASGSYSTSFGFSNRATGNSSASLGGYGNLASGSFSIAMGNMNLSSGVSSTAMGDATIAQGVASTSMGAGTIARGFASTVIGIANDPLLPSSQSNYTTTTPLFVVGNGDGINNRSNAFIVRKDGNIAVGNFQPEYRLDVGGRIRLRGTTGDPNSTAGIWFNNIANTSTMGFMGAYNDNTIGFYGLGAFWGLTMNTSSGNVGIGTVTPSQKLSVVGNITATGTISSSSDIRFKTNIQLLGSTLSSLLKLNPITYHWKKDFAGFSEAEQLGFSAQEVERLFPQLVLTDANGYKSVDYGRLTPVLVQAVKEQQQEIDELKSRLEKIEKLLLKTNF